MKKAPEKAAPERPRKLLVYRGAFHDIKKKLSRWTEVTEAEFKAGKLPKGGGRDALYSRKVGSGYSVGQVVSVEYNAETPGSIYAATMKYLGQWPDKDTRLAWALEAKDQELRIETDAAQHAVGDPLVEQLRPVRRAYLTAVGTNRTRLLAAVVAIVTGSGQ